MEPAAILAIIDGALLIIQKAVPAAQQLFSSGEVSAEDQAALKAKIDSIRDGSAFSGDAWKIDPPAAA
jgi:hypothetical protein